MFCFGIAGAQLTMEKVDGGILILDGKSKVLRFQTEVQSKNGTFERCNYIHPLYGLNGEVLTEDFPDDHLHHRGIFWAWHQVWIGDKRIGDPWLIKDFDQDIVELEFMKNANGSVVFGTEVEWKSDKWKKNGIKAPYIREYANITVHPQTGNYRKIDFQIKLLALDEELRIGGSEDKKGYSGFSVRCKMPKDLIFSGPAGKVTPEVEQVQSEGYINLMGSFGENGGKSGIVIADSPGNPDYPQPWILRKKNSMQNVVWPGKEAVLLSCTDPLVLNYSLLIYSGKLNDKKISKAIK